MNGKDTQKTRHTVVFPLATVIFALIALFVYFISTLPALKEWFSSVFAILSPVILGLSIAYLCNPILRFMERHPLRRIRSMYLKRILSIFLTYLTVILFIGLLGILIVPQLIHSFKELFAKYDSYIANTITYINQLIGKIAQKIPFAFGDGDMQDFISLEKVNALLQTLINSLSGIFNLLLENISAYGSKIISGVTDLILALFISFYMLASKEKRGAQIRSRSNQRCEPVRNFTARSAASFELFHGSS